ncbi:tRNA (5-methylaminomethyl-2-thiouridylate)-methyltransferase [Selenomonas ruminantium]|uniref:tRNA-specific 2-thiouridylase MnmA n=1 Tax=Selenomonas ruminantium TaxID=971 RepID=A0A1M6UY12_SELRU|nr:tRNA 2-thiouridine(34) synthase MnmA [Selenomonas ruminantium]SHK74011.1 tRNA (5-methylaminomethyl-2-thiouridylate)-methyltransferase [Selenomonas ruminantium]
MSRGKVIVGMSGGVDSAVTAYLLKVAGFEVIGITLKSWTAGSSKCCEIDEASRTAAMLGITYYPWNTVACFHDYVTKPFVADYEAGRTPNPCVECNRYVKWDQLLAVAASMQADYVATGHYAVIEQLPNGRYTLKQGADGRKDQSYMLYKLTQEQLARTILPLGRLTKQEVRDIARKAGLNVADKEESQEICFVTEGSYTDYIEEYSDKDLTAAGNFVDEAGKVLGRHKGIIHYTVGQRKGLGLALGYPAYVKEIRAAANEVVVSREEGLYTDEVLCENLCFMSLSDIAPGEVVSVQVKIRYHHAGAAARLQRVGEDRIQIRFAEPVRAPAPGQSAVFYDDEGRIIGGGKIIA